uniref:DUF5672 domain-containing protein n=2 Tax=Eutreptiella gymnastica TaxID=73025 RepID=A0A7S1N7T7_9EUGL|mmetsp:Transcript_133767/g.232060  ORF Transcript_133767/g.232060 Transcript_133767/m.232060 type:complete len:379 (+) Transcript_133767:157-1293(+)
MALSTAQLSVVLICITMIPLGLLVASLNGYGYEGLTQRKPQLQVANGFSQHVTHTSTNNEGQFQLSEELIERVAKQVAEKVARNVANEVVHQAMKGVEQTMSLHSKANTLQQQGSSTIRENTTSVSKSAFIVLGKPIEALVEQARVKAIIKLFIDYLGPTWIIQIFYTPISKDFTLRFMKDLQSPTVLCEPIGKNLPTRRHYTALLKSPEFWRQMRGEKVLSFQTDTVICKKAPRKVDDFLEWDYIGAPWSGNHLRGPGIERSLTDSTIGHCLLGGNGGLSIRTKSVILRTLEAFPPDEFGPMGPEDGFYVKWLPLLGFKVAPFGVATQWASELWWLNKHSVGFHQLNEVSIQKVMHTCPEARLLLPAARQPELLSHT